MAGKKAPKQSKRRVEEPAPVLDHTARAIAAPPGVRGRPPTYRDVAVTQRIVNFVRGGNYFETAAAASGVSVQAARSWLKQAGEVERIMRDDPTFTPSPDESLLLDFLAAVEQARGEAEAGDILRIGQAASGVTVKNKDGSTTIVRPPDWKAAAWRVSHRAPERWGRNLVEMSGRDGAPVEVVLVDPLQAIADKLDKLDKLAAQEERVPDVPDAE